MNNLLIFGLFLFSLLAPQKLGDLGMSNAKVIVYTTAVCGYCRSAKQLLDKKGISYKEIDVSDPNLREKLMKKANGKKTVPQIFIGELHVGGYDELYALSRAGDLEKLTSDE